MGSPRVSPALPSRWATRHWIAFSPLVALPGRIASTTMVLAQQEATKGETSTVNARRCASSALADGVADPKTHVWASRQIFGRSRPGRSSVSPRKASGKCLRLRRNRGGPTKLNKVSHIEGKLNAAGGASPTVDFMYGADGNRVVQLTGTTASGNTGGDTARTVYVGMGGTGKSMYERTTKTWTVEHVHFLYAGGVHGGNAFAVRVVTADKPTEDTSSPPKDPTVAIRYQHFDHLGSVTASTDENGRVVGASGGDSTTVLGYDPWGARRNPDGRTATTYLRLQAGHREFTGHETIPEVGLVNMNGRVYDPELGRFLSPDPNVQFVADLQSYNRYTYAANNPLRYTDPTGYFLGGGFDFFVSALATITAIAVCTGPQAALCAAGFALGMTIYTTASAINSGAGWDQACAMGFTGFALGTIGGGVMGDLGVQGGWQILGGAISGAASSAVMTEMSGGGSLGKNILEGAFSGAAGAAVGYALQEAMVSVASAELQQGGGAGGGGGALADVLDPRQDGTGALRDMNGPEYAEVDGTYVRKTGVLTLTDKDTGQTVTVPAESGGKPYGDAIPAGKYEILKGKNSDFYRLDAEDSLPRNDKIDGTGRGEFRLHRPGLTTGCVEVPEWGDWGRVKSLLSTTSTTTVTDMASYQHFWGLWTTTPYDPILRFGTLTVQ